MRNNTILRVLLQVSIFSSRGSLDLKFFLFYLRVKHLRGSFSGGLVVPGNKGTREQGNIGIVSREQGNIGIVSREQGNMPKIRRNKGTWDLLQGSSKIHTVTIPSRFIG